MHTVRKAWVERFPAQGQKAGAGNPLVGEAPARFRRERFRLRSGFPQQIGKVGVDFSHLHGGAVRQVVNAGGRFPQGAEQVQGGCGIVPVDVIEPSVHGSGEGRTLREVLGDENAAVRPVQGSQPDDRAPRRQNRLFRPNQQTVFTEEG